MSSPATVTGKRKLRSGTSDEDETSLIWTVAPEESFLSDWQIELKVGREKIVYNVHRSVLVVGQGGSKYFVRLFKNSKNFSESEKRTTAINDFSKEDLEVFPFFLDYLYDKMVDTDVVEYIREEKALNIYRLADYFAVDELKVDIVGAFIRLGRDANSIADIRELPIYSGSDQSFWLAVFDHVDLDNPAWYTSLVADFCVRFKDSLDPETFQPLINSNKFSLDAATFQSIFQLLEAEKKISPNTTGEDLTELQILCIKVLSKRWEEVSEETIQTLMSIGIAPGFISKLWMRMIRHAGFSDPPSLDHDSKIVVRGAAVPEVNGVYYYDGEFRGRPVFRRDGMWQGSPAGFIVFWSQDRVSRDWFWYISLTEYEEDETDREIYFYCCKSEAQLPPKTTWEICSDELGVGPAPRIIHELAG